jgi:hypothetical protein
MQENRTVPFLSCPKPALAGSRQESAFAAAVLNGHFVIAGPAFQGLAFDPAGKFRGGHGFAASVTIWLAQTHVPLSA